LKGGAGNDVLVGGFDDDVLFGDAGADFILIGTTDPDDLSLLGKDTINGFETGKDMIVLGDVLQAFSIDDTKAFTDGFVILTKDGANTVIEFDKDGSSGGASAVTLATVVGATVAQSDFEFGPI
jgi:Ca2+-binding RTX toxin-like protein